MKKARSEERLADFLFPTFVALVKWGSWHGPLQKAMSSLGHPVGRKFPSSPEFACLFRVC